MLLGCVSIMMKLIFGEHCLNENSGRFTGLPRQSRLCTMCTGGHVEDFEHFVIFCQKYQYRRERLFSQICSVFPPFLQLTSRGQLLVICCGSCENLEPLVRLNIMEISCINVAYMYKLRLVENRSSRMHGATVV